MRPLSLALAALLVFAVSASAFGKSFYRHDKWCELQDLHYEISTLNLLNGLYLSKDQTQKLLSLAKKVKTLHEQFQSEYAALYPEMKQAYTQLYKEAMAQTGISETTRATADAIHQRETRLQFDYGTKIGELEKQAEKVLTSNQMHILNDFQPCLLPPQKLGEPARAGQANDSDELRDGLRNIRKIPDDQWQDYKPIILKGHIKRVAPVFGLRKKAQKEAEKKRMEAIIEKLRAMDDKTFENNLDSLADEVLEPLSNLQQKARTIEPLEKQYLGFSKVGKLLLDQRCVKLYEERLK